MLKNTYLFDILLIITNTIHINTNFLSITAQKPCIYLALVCGTSSTALLRHRSITTTSPCGFVSDAPQTFSANPI